MSPSSGAPRQRRLRLGRMLSALHESETELAQELLRVRERHQADAEVYHLAKCFREWSIRHAEALRPHAERYGKTLPEHDDSGLGGLAGTLRELGGKAISRTPSSGAVLLHDLRNLHLLAQRVATDYVIVGTTAQALRDRELMAAVAAAQDETERLIAWLTTQLKETAPQVLAVG